MNFREQGWVAQIIWALLIIAALVALVTARWSLAFVSVATLALSVLPAVFVERFQIRLPHSFIAVIVLFVFGSIFLGEAFDFYERYWWWDVLLHGFASIGFGLIGFLFVFMLFEGDRFAAPPSALGFIAFCFAVALGASWEIFEYGMDQIFGLNMQKSGLTDTMWDLIVDLIGAALGGTAGFLYLKRRRFGGLASMIRQFVEANRRFYRKDRNRD